MSDESGSASGGSLTPTVLIAVIVIAFLGSIFTGLEASLSPPSLDVSGLKLRPNPFHWGTAVSFGLLVSVCSFYGWRSGLLKEVLARFDQHQKRKSATPFTHRWAVVVVVTPFVVEKTGIREAFERNGFEWENVTVAWPKSSLELLNALREALDALGDDARELDGRKIFEEAAPKAIDASEHRRRNFPASLISFVQRLKKYDAAERYEAIRAYLLLSNLDIHRWAAQQALWNGFGELGLEVPEIWTAFGGIGDYCRHVGRIVGADQQDGEMAIARLTYVDGADIRDDGVSIRAPLSAFQRRWRQDECKWFLPQVQLALDVGGSGKKLASISEWTSFEFEDVRSCGDYD